MQIFCVKGYNNVITQGDDMRYKGFTLAEVLITLGVIGVVAAMTLPTLIQEHRDISSNI